MAVEKGNFSIGTFNFEIQLESTENLVNRFAKTIGLLLLRMNVHYTAVMRIPPQLQYVLHYIFYIRDPDTFLDLSSSLLSTFRQRSAHCTSSLL